MGWGASDIDPAGKAVVTGAYAPAVMEARRVRAAAPGLPLFFFARIVADSLAMRVQWVQKYRRCHANEGAELYVDK